MVLVYVVVSLALVRTILASAPADGPLSVHDGCRNIINHLTDHGYSRFEMSAYCRANLPPETCRAAFEILGEQPWPSENIGEVCQSWETTWSPAAVQGRDLNELTDIQRDLDKCLKNKGKPGSDLFLCQVGNGDGYMPMDAMKFIVNIAKMKGALPQKSEQWGPIRTHAHQAPMILGLGAILSISALSTVIAVLRGRRGVQNPNALLETVPNHSDEDRA
mmetsp:Transcript_80271/g.221988  ORF Transcript_80271/g.221988 Transcript_80271/m.221988 type:complete len:219 (+) Transcript_80271:107-763(+)|eukprot:CAMPEP_0179099622 /NCGR_PEP_ID=MMETSP0796-20121207/45967_1 /TAXON_ID=73915 /ORGANISM="Pyrodinium bahamense, Strain pbaha01" /LENGTH=218 /DNA_ID=CAMNT_0020797423 /DNA_START=104 /DNA_END=760 /DNA_ORIENTATION=+